MTALIFIAVLVVLVLIHELGHFCVAKLTGVGVDEFGVGFPPRLWAKKWRGTEYSINLLPLGGFVKLKGEFGETDTTGSFNAAPIWSRIAVVVAGVVMNALLAIILLFGGYLVGFTPITQPLANYPGAKVIRSEVIVAGVMDSSVAQKAGVESGDVLINTPGQPAFTTLESFQAFTRSNTGKTVTITVRRSGVEKPLTVALGTDAEAPFGVALAPNSIVKLPFWQAARAAGTEFWGMTKAIGQAIWGLIKDAVTTHHVSESVSGPVGIYQATATASRAGITVLLSLVVMLSINLAVLNILPIPALDGGRLLVLVLEAIFGRRVIKEELEAKITTVGFILMMILIVLLTYRDIVRL